MRGCWSRKWQATHERMTARAFSRFCVAFCATAFLVQTPVGMTAGARCGWGRTSDFPSQNAMQKTASPPNAAHKAPCRALPLIRRPGKRTTERLPPGALSDANRAAAASATPIASALRNAFRGASAGQPRGRFLVLRSVVRRPSPARLANPHTTARGPARAPVSVLGNGDTLRDVPRVRRRRPPRDPSAHRMHRHSSLEFSSSPRSRSDSLLSPLRTRNFAPPKLTPMDRAISSYWSPAKKRRRIASA